MLMTNINMAIQQMKEIAQQASSLASGLQNAAPPGTSLQSAKYLSEIAAYLEKTAHAIDEISQAGSNELNEKLLQFVRELVSHDDELRKQHDITDKFRFIRERIQTISQQLEQEIHDAVKQIEKKTQKTALQDDEVPVYVYLYNAHGALLSNWQNLLTPKVFYEYSVNRPIYTDKAHIEMLLRSKTDRTQHAYLTVAVKSDHVIKSDMGAKDNLGNPVIRIKEGSLSFEKLLTFTFNEQDYILSGKGDLIKKE